VIPPRPTAKIPRPCDIALYCESNLVESFFNKTQTFQGVAKRYDKLQETSIAGVQLASTMICSTETTL